MLKQELNRDIRRLWKESLKDGKLMLADATQFNAIILPTRIKELSRLYNTDPEFEYVSKESIRILLKLNHTYQAIPYHRVGSRIEIKN